MDTSFNQEAFHTSWQAIPYNFEICIAKLKFSKKSSQGEAKYTSCKDLLRLKLYFKSMSFFYKWYMNLKTGCVGIRGEELLVFRKIRRALFSWNTRFEICSFALLPPNNLFLLFSDADFKVWDLELLLWKMLKEFNLLARNQSTRNASIISTEQNLTWDALTVNWNLSSPIKCKYI